MWYFLFATYVFMVGDGKIDSKKIVVLVAHRLARCPFYACCMFIAFDSFLSGCPFGLLFKGKSIWRRILICLLSVLVVAVKFSLIQ
jgi:hypothetical protein